MQWLKRSYDSAGLTQYPTGKHLAAVQALFGGNVILCLDVSGSMSGANRLPQAIEGCTLFVTEAVAAGYSVGGVLWNQGVHQTSGNLTRTGQDATALFMGARSSGGNDILPTLRYCEAMLEGKTGDLVIAIFGDGDLGNAKAAIAESRRLLEKGIRVITCGLGNASAEVLGAISSETSALRVAKSDDIAGAIAEMASGLKRRT